MKPGPKPKPLSERYEVDERGCWLWLGATNSAGYGIITVDDKEVRAHRYAFEHVTSTRIPPGMSLDHLCGRKRCINPSHLEPVTHRENIQRHHRKKTNCVRGHPLSGDNLYITPAGRRKCRACDRIRSHNYYHYNKY